MNVYPSQVRKAGTMIYLIKQALNRLRPAEPVSAEQDEDSSSMADLVRLLEADGEAASVEATERDLGADNPH